MENDTWRRIRTMLPEYLPLAALIWGVLLTSSPFIPGALGEFLTNRFIIFILFWVQSVLLLLAFNTDHRRPWKTALLAITFCAAVWAVYQIVWVFSDFDRRWTDIAFAALTGSVLGSLAGTWGVYLLEVYQDYRY